TDSARGTRPTIAGHRHQGESRGNGQRSGHGSTGGYATAVANRDDIDAAHLSLAEVTGVRHGHREVGNRSRGTTDDERKSLWLRHVAGRQIGRGNRECERAAGGRVRCSAEGAGVRVESHSRRKLSG